MKYRVVLSPEASDQLSELYRYLAWRASATIAKRYTDAVLAYCETLSTFPHRGTCRNDLRPGLRLTHYRGRTVIAFAVDDAQRQVSIIGLFHGGQNFEAVLSSDPS